MQYTTFDFKRYGQNDGDMVDKKPPVSERPNFFDQRNDLRHSETNFNEFSADISSDFSNINYEADSQLRYTKPDNKRDVPRYSTQLPYLTTPHMVSTSNQQMIPKVGQFSRICFNDALAKSGPFYLRSWQIWDNAPFLPSLGDVTKDPTRMAEQTKGFSTEYKVQRK